MKFLWKNFQELISNKVIFFLTVLQFILSICCYQVCYSITHNYISAKYFLSKNYNNNSVVLTVADLTKLEGDRILSTVEDTDGFYGIYYEAKLFEQDENSEEIKKINVASYSQSAFTQTNLEIRGENIDFDKDYGDKIPVIVSYMLGKTYDVGTTIELDDSQLYVCGALENDKFYYLTEPFQTQWFVMAYDKDGKLGTQDRIIGDTVFLRSKTSQAYEKICDEDTFSFISEGLYLKKYNYKDSIQNLFKSVASFLIIGVWIVILSTYSLLSSNYMAFKHNETRYRIQLCIGAKKMDIIQNYIVRMILCIAISTPISALLFWILSKYITSLYLTPFAILCGLIVATIVTLISVVALGIKVKRFKLVGAISAEI